MKFVQVTLDDLKENDTVRLELVGRVSLKLSNSLEVIPEISDTSLAFWFNNSELSCLKLFKEVKLQTGKARSLSSGELVEVLMIYEDHVFVKFDDGSFGTYLADGFVNI